MKSLRVFSLLTAAILAAVTSTAALELDGVKLPDSILISQSQLLLNGAGTRRATIFRVRVYVAGLYLESKNSSPEAIVGSSGLKQLQMQFVRAVDADDVTDAWKRGFEENNPGAAKMLPKLNYLINGLGDMQVGSTITLTFTAQGVELRSGPLKNAVNDPGFAAAVLKIWLGANPPDEGLKIGLLGRS
jgi:hypothetical protein